MHITGEYYYNVNYTINGVHNKFQNYINIFILHTGNEQNCVIVSYQLMVFVTDLMCESLCLLSTATCEFSY